VKILAFYAVLWLRLLNYNVFSRCYLRGASVIVSSLFCFTFAANAEVDFSFIGPDIVHLRVWHAPEIGEVSYVSSIVDPDGNETELLTESVNYPGVTFAISSDMVFGDWIYKYTLVVEDEDEVEHVTEGEGTIEIEGPLRGTLLFSETIALDINVHTAETVTVSADRVLTAEGNWGEATLYADEGEVILAGSMHNRGVITAGNNGRVIIQNASWIADCWLAVSGGGEMEVYDDAVVSGSSINVNPGGVFYPGNAAHFSGNRYYYHTPALSGFNVLKAGKGTVYFRSGSEGATPGGSGHDIVLETWPISVNNLSSNQVRILTECDIEGGLTDCDVTVGSGVIPSEFTGEVRLSGLNLASLSLYGTEDCTVTDCEISGSTLITMGKPTLTMNVLSDLTILGGTEASISENAVHGTLTFSGYDPDFGVPLINNADLLGTVALRYSESILFTNTPPTGTFKINSAYYGSEIGPITSLGAGFLGASSGHQGGWMRNDDDGDLGVFDLNEILTTRSTSLDPKKNDPLFWVAGTAGGQGVMPWHLDSGITYYKGIPMLLSFDVKTSANLLATPDIYLMVDGARVDPVHLPPELSRDLNDFPSARVRIGGTTVNFRLEDVTADSLDFTLYRDGRGGPVALYSDTLNFVEHPWTRALRVAVIPIQIDYTFSSIKAPSASAMVRYLKYTIPGLLPVPYEKLRVDIKPTEIMETNLGLLSNLPGLSALAAKLALWHTDTKLAKPKYDLVVAVMPPGSIRILSKELDYFLNLTEPAAGVNYTYGDNFWLQTSRVLFIDADTPMAVMHELGHAAGLYRETEQYDMPEYKETEGKPLRGFSTAALDPKLNNVVRGLPDYGIVHFAKPGMTWYNQYHEWIDVMGLPETQVWPDPGTAGSIQAFFDNLLIESAPGAAMAAAEEDGVDRDEGPAIAEEEQNELDTLTAETAYSKDESAVHVVFSGISIEPSGGNRALLDRHNTAMEASRLPKSIPLFEEAESWFSWGFLRFLDAASNTISEATFDLPQAVNEVVWWTGAAELPAGCERIELREWANSEDALKEAWRKHPSALTVSLDPVESPAGSVMPLRWSLPDPGPHPDTRLVSQVCFSTNNGTAWEYAGGPIRDHTLELDTASFAADQAIAVKVIVSDGFTSAEDIQTGILIADRPPSIFLQQPRHGDTARTGESWPLRADAWDIEDGAVPVSWTSSRDGALADPAILSEGAHQITVAADDSAGNAVATNIEVRVVAAPESVDVRLASITILGANREFRNNAGLVADALMLDQTNTVGIVVENSGVSVGVEVALMVTDPDGGTLTPPPQTFFLPAFESARVQFEFIPTLAGAYDLSVTATPDALPDRAPSDNARILSTYTRVPRLWVRGYNYQTEFASLTARYDLPYPPVHAFQVEDSIDLFNKGYTDLVITNLALVEGQGVGGGPGFYLINPPALPLTLAPGEDYRLDVRYVGDSFNPELAVLRILCNDPRADVFDTPIYGLLYAWDDDDESYRDEDGDNIPSYIEDLIGLDPLNPDTDGDGLPDGGEDTNANGVREWWETDALDDDTDGDGLLDGEEDANRNRGRDFYESSPLLADTDGDSLSDGQELKTRTDPIDPLDFLSWNFMSGRDSTFRIEWDGRDTVEYRVEYSTDLEEWETAPSGSEPDEQSIRTPDSDGPLQYRPPSEQPNAFYRLLAP